MPTKRRAAISPKRVFQSVDIGSGRGYWLLQKVMKHIQAQAAKKKSKGMPVEIMNMKKYAAVDPEYRSPGPKTMSALGGMQSLGIHISQKTGVGFLEEMAENGWRARNLNIDLPIPKDFAKYEFHRIFSLAGQVLYPGGKIFVTSENLRVIHDISTLAKLAGLIPGKIINVPEQSRKTMDMVLVRQHYANIYKIVVTFPGVKEKTAKK